MESPSDGKRAVSACNRGNGADPWLCPSVSFTVVRPSAYQMTVRESDGWQPARCPFSGCICPRTPAQRRHIKRDRRVARDLGRMTVSAVDDEHAWRRPYRGGAKK